MKPRVFGEGRSFWPLLFCLVSPLLASAAELPPGGVPGVVVDYSLQSSGIYIGSPSLAVLTNGDYVASHDEFGPKSSENTSAISRILRSGDRGRSWKQIAKIDGQFWSTLFVHRGALYLLGTHKHHGDVVIRRSIDGGSTWTTPSGPDSGLLRDDGEYHCAPVPVLEHAGRLWRAMERRIPPRGWGVTYCAGMLSVPADADLLNRANWTFSNFLPGNTNWLKGTFGGWLEGNAVLAPDGRVLAILRVDTTGYPEKAALVNISPDGTSATFDAATEFVDFPGGAKKATIRNDARTGLYWSLATLVPEQFRSATKPASVRNTLALVNSANLREWNIRCYLLHHSDTSKHGFQYVDWLFEGEDIIALCRTAYDDDWGGARNFHDANYLTFHRWQNFRALSMADSVPLSAP